VGANVGVGVALCSHATTSHTNISKHLLYNARQIFIGGHP
jgi:hypothetical protein